MELEIAQDTLQPFLQAREGILNEIKKTLASGSHGEEDRPVKTGLLNKLRLQ